MSTEQPHSEVPNQDLDEVLVAYLKAVEAGQSPDRQALLVHHPDIAEELAEFFAGVDQFEQLAAPLRAVRQSTVGASPSLAGGDTADNAQQTGPYFPSPHSPTPATLPPAEIPGYQCLGELGRGGMGVVYRARQVRLNRLVALKVIRLDRYDTPSVMERFDREVRAVGQLDHPHLVEAHDAGEHKGVLYLAMKLIDGIDLGRLVKQNGPLPVGEACEVVRQAALGLQYLHERGLVHRDIKPSNLMRTPEGQVKVLDLGLARWLDAPPAQQTEPGMVLGTWDYVSPEQADDAARADIRADLYSLGATLFYLLTGRAPFSHREQMTAKLKAHALETPPDIATLRPDIPPRVRELVRRLLAKNPAERPATPRHLADELSSILSAPPSRPPRRCRVPILAGVGLLGVLGLLLWELMASLRSTRDPVGIDPPDRRLDGKETLPRERLQVLRLDVKRYARQGDRFENPVGVLGEQSFGTRLNDAVTVAGRLSAPAYCYLIAYRPDGTEEICFPEEEGVRPEQHVEPKYPSVSAGVRYGLTEGTGLMAFVLVASRQPLPAYAEWRKERGRSPWRLIEALPEVIWRFDGVTVWEMTPGDPEGTRGKGRKAKGLEPLVELIEWLRQEKRFETVSAVAFPVLK